MPYAQIAFTQTVGDSKLTIKEIGCKLVADCDILEDFGIHVDPPTLNGFYKNHGVYTWDATDRANDDLNWLSPTKYNSQISVRTGAGGWPDHLPAVVEFRYKNHLGVEETHFSKVVDLASHAILDAWDNRVKTPAEYEHVYGQPIAWASYTLHTPQTTPAGIHSAPVSAPAAVVPPSQPAPQPAPANPAKLYLPPSVWIWHIYKPGGPYTLPYAIGALNPKMFGGLTKDILGNPAPHIYLIHTENAFQGLHEVAIYAGPDTVAQFPGTGHGEGESTGAAVSEVVPAPAPVPAAEPAIVYTRFEQPMQLVTNKEAHTINFESGNIAADLPAGSPFIAVGKATLPSGDVYFMDDNSFGIADQIQRTPITVGIKTIDLSPAPKPEGVSTNTGATHVSSTASAAPVISGSTATSTPAVPEPNLPWQRSMQFFMNTVPYIVKEDMKVSDFATGNDEKEAKAGLPIPIGGKFTFMGNLYYRPQSSIDKGTWYGFPVTSLVKQDASNTPFQTHDDINQLGSELDAIKKAKQKAKHATIVAGGTADGWLARFKLKRSHA